MDFTIELCENEVTTANMLNPLQPAKRGLRNSARMWATNTCILLCLSATGTAYSVLVHYSRRRPGPQYHLSTTVMLAEMLKLALALLMVLREERWSFAPFFNRLRGEILRKPMEMMKVSVPSVIYAIQNNLILIGLSNLDSATYQVTSQLKILTTAVFMKLLLGKQFTWSQRIALALLCFGETFVHLDTPVDSTRDVIEENGIAMDVESPSMRPQGDRRILGMMGRIMTALQSDWGALKPAAEDEPPKVFPLTGMVAVGVACIFSGFAGVYFELVLKRAPPSCSFWLRNVQLYLCGTLASAAAAALTQGASISHTGFFHGYNSLVLLIAAAMMGIFVSIVIQRLSNIWRCFATALSVVFTTVISLVVFNTAVGLRFLVGAFFVVVAPFIYITS